MSCWKSVFVRDFGLAVEAADRLGDAHDPQALRAFPPGRGTFMCLRSRFWARGGGYVRSDWKEPRVGDEMIAVVSTIIFTVAVCYRQLGIVGSI